MKHLNSREIRTIFLDFFQKKGHRIVPSSALVPKDQSVLFTTAGMQQFSLYLAGEKDVLEDFGTRHLASVQKCFRTDDIEKIGDDTHHTFFEMLGNWSIGQDEKGSYFKQGAIELAYEFLNSKFQIPDSRLWITVFKGNKEIPKDEESKKIWQKLGIPKERIREFGPEDNFWGPVGETGVCGPNTEIYYDRGKEYGCGREGCGPNCPYCNRFVEIWNLVFIEYKRVISSTSKYKYVLLPQKSVDTGMGLERVAAILQNKPSAYETDLFFPLIKEMEKLSSFTYEQLPKAYRIIADHIRGAVFLISEGILPSNLGQGYILRRLLRRAIRYSRRLKAKSEILISLVHKTIEIYKDVYPQLQSSQAEILTVIQNEQEKFSKALTRGLKNLKLQILKLKSQQIKLLSGKTVFDFYQSYGFPIELTKEIAQEYGMKIDEKGFKEEFKKHQEVSRKGAERKFGGHGQLTSDNFQIIKLHTATHLLHSALRQILGSQVRQMGSDINEKRLRFDFSFPRKLTNEEIKKIEDLVNQKIKENLVVKKEEMKCEKAIKSGALAFFKERYPEVVSVYTIFNPKTKEVFSKEICAGPHVSSTGQLGRFKIIKEQSSGAGIRRIKAVLI